MSYIFVLISFQTASTLLTMLKPTHLSSTGSCTVIGTCFSGDPALVAKFNKKIFASAMKNISGNQCIIGEESERNVKFRLIGWMKEHSILIKRSSNKII